LCALKVPTLSKTITYFELVDDAQAEKLAGGYEIPTDPLQKSILDGYLSSIVRNGLPAWVTNKTELRNFQNLNRSYKHTLQQKIPLVNSRYYAFSNDFVALRPAPLPTQGFFHV